MEGRKSPRAKLEGRRILLISPRFFGYENRILEGLEARGAKVSFVDDRPSNSTLTKILVRLGSSLIKLRLENYHRKEIKRYEGHSFDDLLFIEPESCSAETIKNYQQAFPSARCILYMWDSFENKAGHLRDCLPLFERAFSFDDIDCTKYGMSFRPLFFTPSEPALEAVQTYGFSFVGTIHSDRYKIVKALRAQAKSAGLETYFYPFLPSKLLFWLYRITKPEFSGTWPKDFFFAPLPYSDVIRVFQSSVAVVDIEHPGQRGLTMRTLEVIGANKKLITTNERIINYPFFSPDRIQVVDRMAPNLTEHFLKTAPGPLPQVLLDKFSIDGWIDDLLG